MSMPTPSHDQPRSVRWLLLPLALALLVGAPTIRGGFLPGDDVQLIRDHVLVNRPSLDHLVKLFSVPHRDLYQPVPLATFSFECGIMRWFGLTPTADGPRAGAWVCHVGNILIHAANTWLVFVLLRRFTRNAFVPLLAACLFATHPLSAECIAWLNGRMIMLSTLFTLAAVLAADALLERGRAWHFAVVLVATLLAMMSKISVGLPVLLVLVPWIRRRRPSRTWWLAFAGATLITLGFIALNVHISRRQLATAEEVLAGSRWARTLIALGWYLQHYVIPIGLAPWHPADALVTFADPRVLPSALMLAVLLVVCGIAAWRRRQGSAALVWFFATLAAMLPLIPSRNVLVAERYMYLPGIGLHWIVALVGATFAVRLAARLQRRTARTLGVVAALLVIAPLVMLSWRAAGHYRDNIARFRRIAALYPNHNEVWTRLAWALYDAGRYDEAIRTADQELQRVAEPARSEVYQVQGMALFRAGRVDEALAKLESAVAADPNDEMAYLRLATAQSESGRLEEAAVNFRKSADLMPNYNHPLVGLGQTYRKLNRPDDAAKAFAQVLDNNPYDPVAAVALAEIELDRGNVHQAAERLEGLLRWMPENGVAHANLGVCYLRLGQKQNAIREFRAALDREPNAIEPRINLAQCLADTGQTEEAARHFEAAVEHTRFGSRTVLESYSDFLIAQNELRGAAALWTRALAARPNDPMYKAWYGWVCVLAEQWDLASQALAALPQDQEKPIPGILSEILLNVHANRPEPAAGAVAALIAKPAQEAGDAPLRLQAALRAYSLHHPDNLWPYYLMILLLKADGQLEAAHLALQAFEEMGADKDWSQRARALLSPSIDTQPASAQNSD